MTNEVSVIENIALPEVISPLQEIEKPARLTKMKPQSEPGLPWFEFFIEADGKEICSGLDLQTHYPKVLDNILIRNCLSTGDPLP